MAAVSRWFTFALMAALALAGCRRQRDRVQPSVWPGANRYNTFQFARSGTRPVSPLRYGQVWEAEWFDVPATEPLPGVAHAEHRPLVVDVDRDGYPEIVTSALAQPPATILNREGAPVSGRAWNGAGGARFDEQAIRIVAGDIGGWTALSESSLSAPGSSPIALRLNQRVVALRVLVDSGLPRLSRVLECRDGRDGILLWRYESGAPPELMAVADLDQDGKDELLFVTDGEEHGTAANGSRGRDSCYCIALRGDGSLLWRRGIGAHPYIGCSAGVADLDADGRREVFVAVYSWLNDFGGLAVLNGATGEVRAEADERAFPSGSCVSAGCADFDGDGRPEIAAAVCGARAEVLLYRLAADRLTPAGRADLGAARDSAEVSECRLHGICDLDGDGKVELVLSRCRKRMICRDPLFYPSTFDSCGLVILGNDLEPKQAIPLTVRCQDATLCELVPGGNIELLVLDDRLRLYSTGTD
jgi:hypothetical protein